MEAWLFYNRVIWQFNSWWINLSKCWKKLKENMVWILRAPRLLSQCHSPPFKDEIFAVATQLKALACLACVECVNDQFGITNKSSQFKTSLHLLHFSWCFDCEAPEVFSGLQTFTWLSISMEVRRWWWWGGGWDIIFGVNLSFKMFKLSQQQSQNQRYSVHYRV